MSYFLLSINIFKVIMMMIMVIIIIIIKSNIIELANNNTNNIHCFYENVSVKYKKHNTKKKIKYGITDNT